MDRKHKIKVTETLMALDVELSEFEAEVVVNCIPGGGDGWNEPREPRCYELVSVVQISGPFIPPLKLTFWADMWVEENYVTIDHDIADRREIAF